MMFRKTNNLILAKEKEVFDYRSLDCFVLYLLLFGQGVCFLCVCKIVRFFWLQESSVFARICDYYTVQRAYTPWNFRHKSSDSDMRRGHGSDREPVSISYRFSLLLQIRLGGSYEGTDTKAEVRKVEVFVTVKHIHEAVTYQSHQQT